jgi:molybdenum cofactor synthesis domain-containing protein
MRPFHSTIPFAEARAMIDAAIRPIERVERVALRGAAGRVLAEPIIAGRDVPPFARAAMDGYAVRARDTTGASTASPRILRSIEQVFAGQTPTRVVGAGTCAEVATGAPMPEGADAVVMVEETRKGDGDDVQILAPARAGQNIGRQGADILRGQQVLPPGAFLNASRVGALAALGLAEIVVYTRPEVAIIATGNEIVDPGQPLRPGQIYDINSFTLASVVSEHGGLPIPHRTAADTIEHLLQSLDGCLTRDVVVFSGGSSVGERDLVLDAMSARGEVLFHGLSVKPGKPTAFGVVGGKPVFGMPGYPASCLSNAHVLLAPALRRIGRLPDRPPHSVSVPLGARITSPPGRHQFFSVRLERGAAMPAFKASGDITSMSQADGYIEIEADTQLLEPGSIVRVILF